jgi:hypothetical protein
MLGGVREATEAQYSMRVVMSAMAQATASITSTPMSAVHPDNVALGVANWVSREVLMYHSIGITQSSTAATGRPPKGVRYKGRRSACTSVSV